MRIFLNLLPPEKKRALLQGFVIAFAQSMTLYLFIVVLFLAGTLFSVRMIIGKNFGAMGGSAAEIDDYSAATVEIKQINAYLSRIDALGNRANRWSETIKAVLAVAPAGVRVENLTFGAGGIMRLTGEAATRDDLLTLKSGLSSLPFLTDVSSPLSNLLQKKNVIFELTAHYVPANAESKK